MLEPGSDTLSVDIPSVIEQMDLRVFIRFDEDYRVYSACCIDTGAVATGETIEEAESLIKSILENDLRHAIREGSLKSLFHSQAPYDAIAGWWEAKAVDPEALKRIALDVSPSPQKRGAQSEFRFKARESVA